MQTTFKKTPRVSLSPAQIDELSLFANTTVQAAGMRVSEWFRTTLSVEDKHGGPHFDPVTKADRGGEQVIWEAIEKTYPAHGILGEEFGHREGNGLTWVIDPIDGTRAFMTGMLHWGVLLALFDGEEPVIGVMYQPFTDELFYGTNTMAQYRRGSVEHVLRTRPCANLNDAVLAATSPDFFPEEADQAGFRRLNGEVKMSRFGGDCYLFAMVAMGHIDLALEAMLHPYDIQPMIPIIRGAGGVVTNWEGGDASMGGRALVAGDPVLHRLALECLAGQEAGQ